jgi:hypothetical protein
MKHPSSSKYDYSVDNPISPWYKRLWCFLFHGNAPAAYDSTTEIFRCMKCDNRWKQ